MVILNLCGQLFPKFQWKNYFMKIIKCFLGVRAAERHFLPGKFWPSALAGTGLANRKIRSTKFGLGQCLLPGLTGQLAQVNPVLRKVWGYLSKAFVLSSEYALDTLGGRHR